jgi:hypothetical protein
MVLNEENVVQSYKGRNKYTIINYNYFTEQNNILSLSYGAKAFKENEFKLYFIILQLLNKLQKPLNIVEIETEIGNLIAQIDRATIRNHIEKMLCEGYLDFELQGNKKYYLLANDCLKSLCSDELEDLLTAVQFYKNTAPLKIAGDYSFDSISAYLKDKFSIEHENIDLIFRHNYPHQILDDEVLYEINNAIKNKHSLSFDYNNDNKTSISPIRIVCDGYFGRQYLVGFDTLNNRIGIYRIDKIANISSNKYGLSVETDILKNSWCIAVNTAPPTLIEIDFQFDERTELHLVKKLYRERKNGKVIKKNNSYIFSILVNDYIEMVPWIRTFYGNIKDINNFELKAIIKEDLNKVMVNYEDI